MKPANEWDMTHPGDSAIEFIEKIQLDAYRAGMLRAAEIVPQAGVYGDLNTKARQAILTAAADLKPEDLK